VQHISQELERTGVIHRHIHAIGPVSSKLEKANINLANVLQTTPVIALIRKGFVLGIVLAFVLFFLLYALLPAHIDMTGWGVAGVAVIGVMFGIWSGGIIGLSRKNPVIENNEQFVSNGHYILIVDIPEEREEELIKKITRHHPSVQVAPDSLSAQ